MATVSMKRVALIASEKGGVGKSVFTRTLVDWLRGRNQRVVAYDADGSIGATVRVLGLRSANGTLVLDQDPAVGVGFYQGRAEGERNKLLDAIASKEALYVHDLAGGLLTDTMKIVDDGSNLNGLLDAFESHGYRLSIFHLISPDVGSAQSVNRWLEVTGARADHIAVVNRKHGTPPADFPFWYGFKDAKGKEKGGKARTKLLESGGVEIQFPALQSGAFAKLDSENIPFSKAAGAGLLTITEQAHVAKFWKDFASSIVPALPLLGVETA